MAAPRLLTLPLLAGLLLVALLGPPGGARGQEVSEYGNPWLRVTLGKTTVQAEAVSTPGQLYRGLSHRRELPPGRGMLFILPKIEVQKFCMRGMRFPLDFLWIADGQVVGITPNVPPDFPGDLTSPQPVKYVLEVPAGFAEGHGLRVGDPVAWRRTGTQP
jgi:uncharacterized membrane protein (UPF0127 family)